MNVIKSDREHEKSSQREGLLASKFSYAWVIVAASFSITVWCYGMRLSYGVFFKPMMEEFGWNRAVTSGAYALSTIVLGAFSIVLGWLCDKYGPRLTLTVCGILSGLGITLLSKVSNLWQLYLFFGVILGIGLGAYVPLVTTVSVWFDSNKGLALGIVVSGIGLGPTIIAPTATHLIHIYGWRQTYTILGLVTGIVVVIAAQLLRSGPNTCTGAMPSLKESGFSGAEGAHESHQINHPSDNETEWTLRRAIKDKTFWLLVTSYSCWCLAIIAIPVHIVPFITDIGLSSSQAASILAMISGSSCFGRIGMGAVSDRIGRKSAIITCLAANFITLVWLMSAKNMWMLSLFAIGYGVTYGGGVPQWAALVGDLFGLRAMGAIFGTIIFLVTIPGAAGPVLFGYIFDVTGSYNAAFLVSAICIAAAIFILRFIKREGNNLIAQP